MKAYLSELLTGSLTRIGKDIDALSHEALDASPGGKARAGYDYLHEVAVVNHRIAARLKGEEPAEWPFGDDWAVAPAELRNKAAMKASLEASVQAVVDAIGDNPERMITTPEGDRPAYGMAVFAAIHMNYHDGQLNLVQGLHGDPEMNWM